METEPAWVKASHGGSCVEAAWVQACHEGGCVDVAWVDGGVLVRDSKDPEGPRLRFTPEEWNAFQTGVVRRQFTIPALQEAAMVEAGGSDTGGNVRVQASER